MIELSVICFFVICVGFVWGLPSWLVTSGCFKLLYTHSASAMICWWRIFSL